MNAHRAALTGFVFADDLQLSGGKIYCIVRQSEV